ncbi:hypothetical protein F0L68_09530 [Solihabitans fulvus]|uniref:Uncharacterized protein n=1 Tax=Solihabitans fulvus TaxID=1892852 RepID=A0A5B2XIM8_9PSEU|nr:hypothetical protein [Solihabitans fulvus]KAA2263718.1 hypothetical protein F0L68_09530 [Solihabitans fulvus]
MSDFGARLGLRRWRARRALRSAQLLDEVVDTQLPLLVGFSEERRRRSADYLAELVELAQNYRYYAAGWIDGRELDRRGQATMDKLTRLRQDPTGVLGQER